MGSYIRLFIGNKNVFTGRILLFVYFTDFYLKEIKFISLYFPS